MFFVCLFLGWCGVHKFIEKKMGMGILYLFTFGLFGIGWFVDCIMYAVNKQFGFSGNVTTGGNRRRLLPDQPLPIVVSNIILGEGEDCHYSGTVERRTVTNRVVGHQGGSSGVSIRVAKGVTYRTGGSKGAAIRGDVAEKTPGTLSITSNRIIFTANKGSFDKKLSAITAITPYTNGFEVQIGSNSYQIITMDGEYICDIIRRLLGN